MRIVKIDFSAQMADTFVGYIGEHNETDIHAVPSAAMLSNENITVYKLAFGTGGTV